MALRNRDCGAGQHPWTADDRWLRSSGGTRTASAEVREAVDYLLQAIEGTDKLPRPERDKLAAVLSTKPGLNLPPDDETPPPGPKARRGP